MLNSCKREDVETNYSNDVELIYNTIKKSGKNVLLTKEEIENEIKKAKPVNRNPFLMHLNDGFDCGVVHEMGEENQVSHRIDLPIPDEIIVPIVFHVMHSNGFGNISTEQILSGVDRLNNDFFETNFTFCLANQDPDGNPSSGIIRINVNETYPEYQSVYVINANSNCINSPSSVSYEDIYELSMWPKSHAVNVYIFPQINCGTSTKGYYIGNINSSISNESIGLRYDAIGLVPNLFNGEIMSYNTIAGGTFTHEVGHYFNLRHIWGQTLRPDLDCGNVTETPLSCGGGGAFDLVCDTPPTSGPRNNGCDQGLSCPNALVGNYMDYDIVCYNHFTLGQIQRMHESIFTAGRTGLVNSNGFACSGTTCIWDLDNDGIVSINDLLILLSQWGDPYVINDLLSFLSEFGIEC
jgi:hypothetical protein